MKQRIKLIRSSLMPLSVFIGVWGLHFIWRSLFPEQNPTQAKWMLLPDKTYWFSDYIKSHSYWLGYSYGLSAAFASVAFRNYLKSPCRASKTFAIGGVTFSGLLAFAGCFLIGCCGSPMLVVWLNLFGAAFIPFAKPMMAVLTTLTIGLAWWWMARKKPEPLLIINNLKRS